MSRIPLIYFVGFFHKVIVDGSNEILREASLQNNTQKFMLFVEDLSRL